MNNPEQTRRIDSRWELFIDEWLIHRMEGVTQRLHHPVPQETAMEWDRPWEGNTSADASIVADDDRYRLYYRGSHTLDDPYRMTHEFLCYAESSDGIHWERPELNLMEFQGSKKNNIIRGKSSTFIGPASAYMLEVFKDNNPKVPESERYKATTGERDYGFYGWISSDGIRWRLFQEEPFFPDTRSYDWTQTSFWDPHRMKYFTYLRGYRQIGGKEVTNIMLTPSRKRWRDVRYCTSDDFVHWSEPVMVNFDPPLSKDEQFYTTTLKPYFRAPHLLIGLPKRYMPQRKKLLGQPHGGLSDGALIMSRDGYHFKRWGEAFLRPGLDQKNWFTRNMSPARGILQTSPEEISIYWTEHYHHSEPSRLRRGTIRTDGFVSVHAGYDGGDLITHPVVFEGRSLVINFSTSAYGNVQVELQSPEGNAIEGFRMDECPLIYGDETAHEVSWEAGADVSRLSGKPVRMRFRLRDADLYALRFSS